MSFIITSSKFYNQFTGLSGGGVDYLNTNVGDRVTCVIEGYFFWAMEGKNLTFDSATKKISFTSQFESASFVDQGFKVGDTIECVDTASNPGPFTITEVSRRYIVVAEAVIDEVAQSAKVYGTTLITAMDFYYNLIGNNEGVNYISKTDRGSLQRYTVDGLDAAVTTPVFMNVGTESTAWVTDTLTGDVSQVKVEGVEIADYKQKFKITQSFYHTNLWSRDLLPNFTNRSAPADYKDGKSVKHVCKIDGKFDYYSPEVAHSGEAASTPGRSAWFNQSSIGGRPEYYLGSIVYKDFDTDEVVSSIQATKKTKVEITVFSRNAKFVNNVGPTDGSSFAIGHYLCPTNEADYQNTATTMLQNLRLDAKKFAIGDAAANGASFGTDYQSLTTVLATFVSTSEALITCTIDYSTATKTYLRGRPASNRLYVLALSCSGFTISQTRETDQVNVLCDFNSVSYDQRNEDLLGLKDYFHGFPFPNTAINETNDVRGYQGDYYYESIPFWIETAAVGGVTPTLNKTKIQIVATKSGLQDFVLEEKIFDTSTVRKMDDIQQINIETSRGFILPDDSIYNRANIIRREDLDTGTKAYYEIQYGFVLRFETWIEAIQSGTQVDIFKYVENVVQAWKRYTENGWALKFRVSWEVSGYDQFVTPFQAETSIIVFDEDDAPAIGPEFDLTLEYYDENDVQIDDAIQDEGTTRIKAIFTGDPASFPAGYVAHFGQMFISNDPNQNVFNRRFITSEWDSEEDSPFTSEDLPANGAISSYSSANMRLSYFADRIELDTFYVAENNYQRLPEQTIFISPRLGFTKQVGIGQMAIGTTFIVS